MMSRVHRYGLTLILALAPGLVAAAPADGAASADLIVTMREEGGTGSAASRGAPPNSLRALSAGQVNEMSSAAGSPLAYRRMLWRATHLVSLSGAVRTEAEMRRIVANLEKIPGVKSVTPNRLMRRALVPNDPFYAQAPPAILLQYLGATYGQWWLKVPGSDNDASKGPILGNLGAINAETGWNTTQGSNGIVVAVVDTGSRPHPEITGRLLPGYDFVSQSNFGDPAFSKDGDGWDSDPTDPGDFATPAEIANPNLPYFNINSCGRSSWHGVFITGQLASATNNAIGTAAIDWNARILPVRVLGKCGFGSLADVVAGLRWAAGLHVDGVPDNPNPARVINVSLGGGKCTGIEQSTIDEITARGTVVVVAAGNNASSPSSPADCKGVIAVGANARDGSKLRYSSYGVYATLMAPGGSDANPLYSTVNSSATDPALGSDNSYGADLGSSFAAPLVSGTVALIQAIRPALSPGQLKAVIEQSARTFPTSSSIPLSTCPVPSTDPDASGDTSNYCICTKALCGAGILDVNAALQAAAQDLPPVIQPLATLNVPAGVPLSFQVQYTDAENDPVTLSTGILPAGSSFTAATRMFTWDSPVAGTYFVAFYASDLGREPRSKEVAIINVSNVPVAPATSGGNGGGGAFGWADLLALLCIAFAVRALRKRGDPA